MSGSKNDTSYVNAQHRAWLLNGWRWGTLHSNLRLYDEEETAGGEILGKIVNLANHYTVSFLNNRIGFLAKSIRGDVFMTAYIFSKMLTIGTL